MSSPYGGIFESLRDLVVICAVIGAFSFVAFIGILVWEFFRNKEKDIDQC